jgi:hypothetical protein
MSAHGIAAAIDSTVCPGSTTGPMSESKAPMSWGLTAITMTSAPLTASAFESVVSIP